MVEQVRRRGPTHGAPRVGVVLLHGRGASPDSMWSLVDAMPQVSELPVTWLAPATPGGTWYPQSFLAPLDANQPALDHALHTVGAAVREVSDSVDLSHVVLLGFSQGACLAAEYVLRNPGRYGGLVLFTGGGIGPAGTTWEGPVAFDGTPVYAGTGDPDPHVPVWRVRETVDVLRRRGADAELAVYPGLPHSVNEDELGRAAALVRSVAGG